MTSSNNGSSSNLRCLDSDQKRIRLLAAEWECRPSQALTLILDAYETLVAVRSTLKAPEVQAPERLIVGPKPAKARIQEEPDPLLVEAGIIPRGEVSEEEHKRNLEMMSQL
jgi:hypothetical protein